ncbi:hypothetical protein O181_070368 [Austropuccinia psidii MF-1]|uniref:Uncharacterized protein n=1 Tax=Austropuccinia psidii MF-1 TaxID=1389203 RepID=A0A9Q3F3T1_9BASI|nr:hypothetical protein [Austropuccinia psidii MF-1]
MLTHCCKEGQEDAACRSFSCLPVVKGTGLPSWSLQPWKVSSIWQELLWNSQPKRRKLNKVILDISELKRNYKEYTEWYQLTNVKLDSIINICDRTESKCQVQNDEMEDISILNINNQLRILKDDILEITKNTNQFATHLSKSDSERQKLKNKVIENVQQIHKNYEPHMPRNSTPLTEEKPSVKGILTPFLGEIVISAKDIPKLEEWPTFSGEGEYSYIEFIRAIDILQADFHIPYEIIVGKLQSLFTKTAKKWYYKMRQDHEKHDWSWYRLSALHPDMSDTMISMKILRKCGPELEHVIKCRCVEPCSTEYYINAMEDIISRKKIGKMWTKIPMDSKMVPKISREDRRPERPVLKCHKCGSTSNLANTCTTKTKKMNFKSLKKFSVLKRKKNLT